MSRTNFVGRLVSLVDFLVWRLADRLYEPGEREIEQYLLMLREAPRPRLERGRARVMLEMDHLTGRPQAPGERVPRLTVGAAITTILLVFAMIGPGWFSASPTHSMPQAVTLGAPVLRASMTVGKLAGDAIDPTPVLGSVTIPAPAQTPAPNLVPVPNSASSHLAITLSPGHP